MAKPRPAQAKTASDPMTLMNLTAGKWVSQAIAVAAELGIADLLKDGPRTAADIARTANASEDGIYRLLRALGSVGLFAETGNRRFRLTQLGRLLRRDSSQALGGYARFTGDQSTWRPWGELRHSVRTGEPAFDHVFGMPIFEYFAKMPESAAVFDAAMTSISTLESKAVVAGYDFSGINTLVDVAGGHGLMIVTILKANRRMRGILFDDRASQILQNCHCALQPGGKLLIVDAVIPPGNRAHFGKLLDLEMLVLTPRGRERTQAEFRELLKRSGFRLRRVVSTETHLSVVEGVRA